jgi:hypothetical protein
VARVRIALLFAFLTLLLSAGAARGEGEVRAVFASDGAPTDPADPAWTPLSARTLTLSEQLISPPVGGGSVTEVAVRAIHDGSRLAILLEWADATADRSVGVDTFRDAVAVGFPVASSDSPASPFMGDPDHPVNIWQWTADLEAAARGRGTFAERYPHTTGVWYFPQDAEVHRDVRAWRGHDPVVEFVATGWGTLTRRPTANVFASSAHERKRWRVVLWRPLDTGSPEDAAFKPGETSQLIVAIWEGTGREVNGRKSVTLGWTPFVLDATLSAP